MQTNPHKNLLAQEISPYLLQHKNNPVNWFPWGQLAFEAAKKDNKPIFLSIGYSTCYWCHVMEKDSFELQEVADVLNEHFICIKVDREERPDIDQIYMDAVVGLTGHGGWPMSVFLTPDLKPFWGGTFFYRAQFISILQQINQAWIREPDNLIASAQKITDYLNNRDKEVIGAAVTATIMQEAKEDYKQSFDRENGGFGSAPKFPPSMQISFLLREYLKSNDYESLQIIKITLDGMAKGGLFDQIGGGFHRYSVDAHWLVPHFEKMLYDNALLAVTYLEAYKVTEDESYAAVSKAVLDYLLLQMRDSDGAFYAAQDAGEVGKEGEYYVWKQTELLEILSQEEFAAIAKLYGVSESGNFEEHANIFCMSADKPWADKNDPLVLLATKKMLEIRSKRIPPHRDDKILTAWNGLIISAMAKGFAILGNRQYLLAAQKAAGFLKTKHSDGEKLFRRSCGGEAGISGFLDDYAFLIEALLNLYEADLDLNWLNWARSLQAVQDKVFWDETDGGYWYSEAKEVIVRKKDFMDSATPSGNSVALLNLLRLEGYFFDAELKHKAEGLMQTFSGYLEKYPSAFPKCLQAIDYYFDRKSVFYGCEENVCALPQRKL